MSLLLTNTTRQRFTIPFLAIKNEILGEPYQLSLSLVGEQRARAINKASRGKDYIPNVLSFPLDATTGEIYLTPRVAARQAKDFGHTPREHLIFLFIHGLLHLQGYDHGAAMERLEETYLRRFRTRSS